MDNELEVIRDEMEQTRANLAEKLGALENQVRETVSGATDAVSSTVEGVKDVVSTVSETVESVTETFNVSKQVEQHPWMALGAAVATGFVIAQVVGRVGESSPHHATTTPYQPVTPPQPAASHPTQTQQHEPGLLHSAATAIEGMLPDMKPVMNTVVSSLGGLAVGGLMGVIRELAARGLPQEWTGDVNRLIDQVTSQLGGKPLDSERSTQLLSLLGLDGSHGEGGQTQGQSQGVPGQPARQEGAPFDTTRSSTGVQGSRGPAAGRQTMPRL